MIQSFGLKCAGSGTLIKLHEAARHLPPFLSAFAYSTFSALGKRDTRAKVCSSNYFSKRSKTKERKTLGKSMNLGVVCYTSWLGLPAPPHLYQRRTEEDGICACLSRATEDKCRVPHLPGDLVGPLISPLLTHQDPFSLTHRKQCSFM